MAVNYWPVRLEHGEVGLRPLRRRDKAAWDAVRHFNRPWLQPWEATYPPGGDPGPPTFAALVRELDRQARGGQMLPWALWVDPTRGAQPERARFVGQVTVSGITRGSAMFAQVGYWVAQRVAGRGLVPTAVAMATDYCFGELNLHRLELAIRPENGNSLRVVHKLGFRYEGARPRYLHINGDWRDHEIYVLTREELRGSLLERWESARDKQK